VTGLEIACRMATRSRWDRCSAKEAHWADPQLADGPALACVVFVGDPQPVPKIRSGRQLLGAHDPGRLVGYAQHAACVQA
jgi:hypothetical protein